MNEKIGLTAGRIWNALNEKGELSVAQLRKEVKGKKVVLDWAIGWLAREDNIIITPDKTSFRLRLSGAQPRSAAAS